MTKAKKITKKAVDKDWTLAKILDLSGSEEILANHGVPCLSCPMAAAEIHSLKIGQVTKMYQLNLKGLLEDLNNL